MPRAPESYFTGRTTSVLRMCSSRHVCPHPRCSSSYAKMECVACDPQTMKGGQGIEYKCWLHAIQSVDFENRQEQLAATGRCAP